MPHILLDTDIGSNVDDALALAVLLGDPEADVVGVTTVYGDTALRARLAARLIRLAGPEREIPVVAGATETLSGRPVWWAGHEGRAFDDLDDEPYTPGDAADFLTTRVAARPGEVDLIAIAPLTNVATATERDPSFAGNLRSLVIMGGDFGSDTAEHNLVSDVTAAQVVFGSDAPITVTGLDVTARVRLLSGDVERIRAAGALGEALGREIDQWRRFRGRTWNNAHDPVTTLTLLAPDLFTFTGADVEVDDDGHSTATGRDTRRTRITTGLEPERVSHGIVDRILRAGR